MLFIQSHLSPFLADAIEILTSKGSTFECFDGVVTTLGEAVGKAGIEGIEDVILPVAQRPSAIFELKEPVAGVEPEIEPAVGFISVRNSHEMVEGLLQCVALHQLIREAQHNIKGSSVLVGQFVAVIEWE